MIKKIEILNEVAKELDRFRKKLDLAIKANQKEDKYSCKQYAAAKRAAMDLKNELTKLTQDSKYRYGPIK